MTSDTAIAKAFSPVIIPAKIRTLFDDLSFAHIAAAHISEATGIPVTIDDVVTQDMLDKVTVLSVLSGAPGKFTSLRGIGHLRNLQNVMIENQPVTRLPEDVRNVGKVDVGALHQQRTQINSGLDRESHQPDPVESELSKAAGHYERQYSGVDR